jgi:FlaA1/EpsC-like NDP-sugar epimerase
MFSKVQSSTRFVVIAVHALTASLSLATAFLLRFDFAVPADEINHLRIAVCLAGFIKVLAFQTTGPRSGWWRFAGLGDVYRLAVANVVGSAAFTIATRLIVGPTFPRSVYVLDFIISFLITCQMRFTGRILRELRTGMRSTASAKRVLIYGAGEAGMTLVREIRSNPSLKLRVQGFLDDDPKKRHESIMGVPILGSGREARTVVARLARRNVNVDEIIIAIPSAKAKVMREAVANCRAAGVPCKTIPGIGDILRNRVLSRQIREVSITDLLGREVVHLEEPAVREHISGRNVLVTGGAGSIGSELCRQITGLGARKLIVFDRAESDLYRIELELQRLAHATEVTVEIGDICDYQRVEEVITRHAIRLVFHAAAYKHVPMMESHLFEAVTNNVFGTWNVVRAARRHSVSGFVMISSDKAVNPTSIMGVTKRISELIVSSLSEDGTGSGNYVSVRFGNVLGSNGSVIPLFQSQIEKGGPITITHPEMRRYFMTTREAVQLVLQASTMGHSSEVFVLDMGEPVKIVDLARNMIRLTGLEPDEDIDIRFVGVRPGEKLFEELLTDSDRIIPTHHKKIKVFIGSKPTRQELSEWLATMECLIAERNAPGVIAHLRVLVPEYSGSPIGIDDTSVRIAPIKAFATSAQASN